MTSVSQTPYYSLQFLKSEEIYFNRSPRSFLARAAHVVSMVAWESLENMAKSVANGFIWFSNSGSPLKKEGRVVIIGSGPAGYTAAIYLARAGLKPLVLQGLYSGGQLMTTHEVENFPGFPEGIQGPEFMQRLEKQAERFGAEMMCDQALKVDLSRYPYRIETQNGPVEASAIILSTGASANRLEVPGTRDGELWQKGVSACAVCDGSLPVFRNKTIFVIGGGDTAMEEALYLSKFASKVNIVHRRNQLRASHAMVQKVLENPKINILYDREVIQVKGEKFIEAIIVKNKLTNQNESYQAGGLFFAISHKPNTAFLRSQLEVDASGYVRVSRGTSETSAPGVFACGDVQDSHYRQAITAAGSGCAAALDAERWLRS